jgi:hypothetical protein
MVACQKSNVIVYIQRSVFFLLVSSLFFIVYFGVTSCVACIVSQAVDVFAAFPASFDNRLSIMKEIGNIWKARGSADETLYPLGKPIYQVYFLKFSLYFIILPYQFLILMVNAGF